MSKRQLVMVFDINKCMGCQTCTIACKMQWTNYKGMEHMWWVKTNTMPGKGSPRDWEQMGGGYDQRGNLVQGKLPTLQEFGEAWEFNHEEVFYGGNSPEVHLKANVMPSWGPNWEEDTGSGTYPNSYFFYMPRLCNICSRPSCVEACPVPGAIGKREEDGIVLINEEKCEGASCRQECSRACPYKVIYRNTLRPVSQMCNFCLPRLERSVAPCCVRQCPGRAGWIDYMDNEEGSVYKLVNKWKVALPLHPEYGTIPNVYYIPPLSPPLIDKNTDINPNQSRIPAEYLRSLFGASVDAALDTIKGEIARKRRGEPSELSDILIARRWDELVGQFRTDPAEVQDGKEKISI